MQITHITQTVDARSKLLSLGLIACLVLPTTTPLAAQAPVSDWSRVATVASDAEVVVTVRGSKPVRCTFVQADESALIVRTGRWQTVRTIARGDIQEIRTGRSRKRRALGLLGGLGGAVAGAFVGGLVGASVSGSNAEDLGGLVIGMNAGLVGGAVLGYRAVTHTKGDLIYRAPAEPHPW